MTFITHKVFRHLLDKLGPQHWWPGESPLEVIIGAILVQNTAWKNVEQAIENLRDADLIHADRLLEISSEDLAELIRPAGYYRLKTKRLRSLLKFMVEEYDGSIAAMQAADRHRLRRQLLAVKGVGPETADSILLYALEQPFLVVDTYTHRIFSRHGWVGYDIDYHQLQGHLTSELPEEVAIYNELHALLVRVGHHYCRKQPRCESCPLQEMLPGGRVVEPDDC
ncbi:MAG: endonuclease III domain-containing protein [Pirellulales bacterium]|nr:endonuclease III domain-containing protein [Pirellulales bacterium]